MRVLFFIPSFTSGGAEAFIVNLVEKLDRKKFKPSIVCIDATPGVYDERLNRIGVKVRTLVGSGVSNPIARYAKAYVAFHRFLRKTKGKIDVVHFNIAQGEDLPFVHMAKKAGVGIRILHSHNSSVNSKLKYFGHIICKRLFVGDATHFLACSTLAAEWLIPKKKYQNGDFILVKNGIDVSQYCYDETVRMNKRKELGIEDSFVILNVGRLNRQKNQLFLLDVFNSIYAQNKNAVLLVAGEGDLRHELESRTNRLGLSRSVKWLGNRNDISELLSASDMFLLPSLYEGLPYTIIEAQASGIKSVISERISKECIITDLVTVSPLLTEHYAKAIFKTIDKDVKQRGDYAEMVKEAGFDINHTVETMEKIYCEGGK